MFKNVTKKATAQKRKKKKEKRKKKRKRKEFLTPAKNYYSRVSQKQKLNSENEVFFSCNFINNFFYVVK